MWNQLASVLYFAASLLIGIYSVWFLFYPHPPAWPNCSVFGDRVEAMESEGSKFKLVLMIVLVPFISIAAFIQEYDSKGHEMTSDKMYEISNNEGNDQRRRQFRKVFAIFLPLYVHFVGKLCFINVKCEIFFRCLLSTVCTV